MSNLQDLWRTEEYHVCKSVGELHSHGQVVIGNAGLAARYNPIPGILENLWAHPCRENMMLAKFTLITHFEKTNLCTSKESADVADDVLSWFLDPNCHACHGTGVRNYEQETCPVCNGAKKYPTWEPSKRGCAEIEFLLLWREQQLRKRNR